MTPATYRNTSTGQKATTVRLTLWNGVIRNITLRAKNGEYIRLTGVELRAEWKEVTQKEAA